jgi:diaminohydroxyphosphoribosylaminopyrimidine deaminase/5-amino-6-(5-phosphoribosylamino)uracil reductase
VNDDVSDRIDVSETDRRHMARAVELGRRGWGRTSPNPMVGCVLVRGGEVVGEGWHAELGGPHAEVAALAAAGERARGSTAYVSLEPCRHEGRTPPCTDALLAAGVVRVVFGAEDPGTDSGGGAAELRAAGVEVAGPLLTGREARRENPAFLHDKPDRPWTALKLAVSLDGRISSGSGGRTRISGPESDAEVHRLRAGFDALMIGTNTALLDDPLLTVRGRVAPRVPPRRIVLDSTGRLPEKARLLHEGDGPVTVITTPRSGDGWRDRIRRGGGRVLEVPAEREGRVALPEALQALRTEDVGSVLCEGGGRVASALLARNVVDRLYLIVAPRFLGPDGVPAFPATEGGLPGPMGADWRWVEEPRRFGEDVWIVLEPEGS